MRPLHGDPPAVSVALGISIGLLSSVVQSLGLTIQRKSHVLEEQLPEYRRRPEHRRPLWLIGFAIFISSNVLGAGFQIAALPVVILAPLGAVSLLWNAVFARLLLGDVFTSLMAIGTILIAAGAVLIAIFGVVPEPNHDLEDLLRLLRRGPFLVYFSLLIVAVVAILVTTHITEHTLPTSVPTSPQVHTIAIPASASELDVSERTPLLPVSAKQPDGKSGISPSPAPSIFANPDIQRKRTWLAISYASMSGILSGMCIIFAKAGVELLLLTIGGKNQFWRWESWVLVGGLVVVALLQLWYLHKSLVLADPTLVCPLAFCFYNISSIVNGLFYFDQFSLLSPTQLVLVVVGMVVLLGGVGALSAREHGIEMGTWREGGDALDAAIVDVDEADGVAEADVTATSPAAHAHVRFSFPLPLPSPVHSPRASTSHRDEEDDDETHRLIHSEILEPPEPPHLHTRAPSAPHLTLTRRRSGLAETSHGALGGLSIGLSPVSPGFALVPRRRVSSLGAKGLGFAGVVRAAMNRRVSEPVATPDAADQNRPKGWKWIKTRLARVREARSPEQGV